MISQGISHIDWNAELENLDVQEQYSHLLNILKPLIENFVPTKEQGPMGPPWSTNPPRSLKRARQEAWQNFEQTRSRSGRNSQDTMLCWNQFQECNQRIRNFAVTSQRNYEIKLADQTHLIE